VALDSTDASEFARLSQELLAGSDHEQTLQRVVDLAGHSIPNAHHSGIFLRQADGSVESPALTDPLVSKLDVLQLELDEGPCLEAIEDDQTFVIQDTTTETRWPSWCAGAAEAGVYSVLSVRLATPAHLGSCLNVYSLTREAFDDDAVLTGQIYATHAGNAITAAEQRDQLGTALQTRHMIGVAQGLLMQRYAITEPAAFQVLARHSQDRNLKLRVIAREVVELAERSGGRLP
jgi:putative methionine-R-sulfoxide reductase with GAF domain